MTTAKASKKQTETERKAAKAAAEKQARAKIRIAKEAAAAKLPTVTEVSASHDCAIIEGRERDAVAVKTFKPKPGTAEFVKAKRAKQEAKEAAPRTEKTDTVNLDRAAKQALYDAGEAAFLASPAAKKCGIEQGAKGWWRAVRTFIVEKTDLAYPGVKRGTT